MLMGDYWESVFTDRPVVLLRSDHLTQSMVNISIQNVLLVPLKQLPIKIKLGFRIKTGSWVIMGTKCGFCKEMKNISSIEKSSETMF